MGVAAFFARSLLSIMAFISDENSQVLLFLFKQNMIVILLSCDCSVDAESIIAH